MQKIDILALETKLRTVSMHVRDAGRATAEEIETAQTNVDTEIGKTVATLDELQQAEIEEMARHADRMADLRAQRQAATAQAQAVIEFNGGRMRELRGRLIGTPQLRLAGGTDSQG